MINIRCLSILCLCSVFMYSCAKSTPEADAHSSQETQKTYLSLTSTYASDDSQNMIDKISIYCFAQRQGETDYTFETKLQNLQPAAIEDGFQVTLTLDGTLPRVFYAVANENATITYPTLTAQTTSTDFEKNTFIINQQKPDSPHILVAKNTLTKPDITNSLSADFIQATACLDINNKFTGFVVDSLVLKNTMTTIGLFEKGTPSGPVLRTTNINYLNSKELYIYPSEGAYLAVYGKYNSIKTVFDIPLTDIQSATRYRVTFKGINDTELDFTNNLTWSVEAWKPGNSIDIIPDWGK